MSEYLEDKFESPYLDRVVDINEYGTGFTVLGASSYTSMIDIINSGGLQSVLNTGVLGQAKYFKNGKVFADNQKRAVNALTWKKEVKTDKPLVFFNIMGRSYNFDGKKIDVPGGRVFDHMADKNYKFINTCSNSFYSSSTGLDEFIHTKMIEAYWYKYQNHPQITVLFDLGKYNESSPFFFYRNKEETLDIPNCMDGIYASDTPIKNREYCAFVPNVSKEYMSQFVYKNSKGDNCVRSDYGFMLRPRINPRYIKGLIIKPKRYSIVNGEADYDRCEMDELLEMTITELDKSNMGNTLIYDINGDLLYPNRLSYNNVRLIRLRLKNKLIQD